MNFAIIETGGKQYLVRKGDTVRIEKLSGDHKEGDAVTFDQVLLLEGENETKLGAPYLSGTAVKAKIVAIGRAKKVEVLKYKAKSRYRKLRGHRQPFMTVSIESI
ncbi:50S ribosomal protein L21 [Candidatus Parcubacteria bacterium]|nr:50S ribosomal protein L21 [Candidatus Parcubacteria bacterium]